MEVLTASRQVSGSTKSILKSGLRPVTAATAEKNLSGAIPQAARSISDHALKAFVLASDPNTTTLFAPYRLRSRKDACFANSSAFARRASKYLLWVVRVVIFLPGLNFRHSSGYIPNAVGTFYSPLLFSKD